MKILFIAPVLPHAKVVSGSIIVHNRIKLLAQRGYQVGLACFVSPADQRHAEDLRPMLLEFECLPLPAAASQGPSWRDWVGLGPAFPFRSLQSPAMARLVGDMVERSCYDIVVAEFTPMAQFLSHNPFLPAVRRVVSCHSCLTGAYRKAISLQPWKWDSWLKRMELPRLTEHEMETYRSADLVLTLTQQERMQLLGLEPNLKIAVVPYGVDVQHFQPSPHAVSEECLVFTGYYSDEANREAVSWFVRTVWPDVRHRHPGLRFYVVGRDPTPEMRDMARRDSQIVVTGEVEDVAPYLNRARVYICPMRLGTGFRGKILQAMACGVPVVSTSHAAEGIPAQTGENILLADTPHVMAECINILLDDADLRQSIATSARELVVSRFAWDRCVDMLEAALSQTVI